MNIFKRIFRSKKAPEATDNAPYYWGTEALEEINRLLAEQVADTERFLSKKFPA